MSDIDDLKEKVARVSKSREWWIAAGSAIIAAVASVFAAYFSYIAKIAVVNAEREISKSTSAFDVYKSFGTLIITGDSDQRCRALLLITATEPQTGVKLINKELAEQIGCEKQTRFLAAIKKSLGTECRNGRPTKRTLSRLKWPNQVSDAEKICGNTLQIPDTFEGPWPDGTISFMPKQSGDLEVWCNCLPSGT
jgi:hypothetical protein